MKQTADVSNVINLDIGQENAERAGRRMYTNTTTSQDMHTEMGQAKENQTVDNEELFEVNEFCVQKYEFDS